MYYGVYAPATELSFSPNGDGAGDRQRLEYKIVKPSTVTATLTGPDGAARTIDSGERKAGSTSSRSRAAPGRAGPAPPSLEGRYRWSITAVDAEGRRSTAERSFSLNNTLGFISVQPSRMTVGRKRGGRLLIGFTLTRPARVNVAITSKTGQLLRVVRNFSARAGKTAVLWKRQVRTASRSFLAPTSPGSWRRTGSGGASLPAPSGSGADNAPTDFGAVPAASILSAITDALTELIGDHGIYAVFILMFVDAVLPAASEARDGRRGRRGWCSPGRASCSSVSRSSRSPGRTSQWPPPARSATSSADCRLGDRLLRRTAFRRAARALAARHAAHSASGRGVVRPLRRLGGRGRPR